MGDVVAVTSLVISGARMCLLVNLRISQHLESHDVGNPDIHFFFQPRLNAEKATGHFMQNTSTVLSVQ